MADIVKKVRLFEQEALQDFLTTDDPYFFQTSDLQRELSWIKEKHPKAFQQIGFDANQVLFRLNTLSYSPLFPNSIESACLLFEAWLLYWRLQAKRYDPSSQSDYSWFFLLNRSDIDQLNAYLSRCLLRQSQHLEVRYGYLKGLKDFIDESARLRYRYVEANKNKVVWPQKASTDE